MWLGPHRCNVDDLCEASEAGTHRAVSLMAITLLSITLIALRMLKIARESPARPPAGDGVGRHSAGNAAVTFGIVALLCAAILVPTYSFALVVALGIGPMEAGLLVLAAFLGLARALGSVFRDRWRWCSSRRAEAWGFAVAACAIVGSMAAITFSLWHGLSGGVSGVLRLVALTCVGAAVVGTLAGGRSPRGAP